MTFQPMLQAVSSPAQAPRGRFELRFEPLTPGSLRPFAFDCDAAGAVDIDALSDEARRDYLFAHMLAGRGDYASTIVPRARRVPAGGRRVESVS